MLGTKAALVTLGLLVTGVVGLHYDAITFGDPILCDRFALPRAAPPSRRSAMPPGSPPAAPARPCGASNA